MPHIARLVNNFEAKEKTLPIDKVWLIRNKPASEEGVQRWHQDLTKLEGGKPIFKTIVITIGQMNVDEMPSIVSIGFLLTNMW